MRLVYASDTAHPHAVISTLYELDGEKTAVPETTELRVDIGGEIDITHYSGSEGPLRQAYLFDGINVLGETLPTGRYPHHARLTNWYPAYYGTSRSFGESAVGLALNCSGSPVRAPWDAPQSRSFSGQIIVNNQIDSPFGAGWNLGGLSRIYFRI